MSVTCLHLASSKSFSSPVSSTVWWLWSYTFSGHPIRRCSWSSGELHCRLGRRFEHHLLPPWCPAPLPAGTWPVPSPMALPDRHWLVASAFSGSPSYCMTCAGTNNAEVSFCRGWKTVISPCRVIPSSPMEKSIAQKLKNVWIHSVFIVPGLSCDLLYSQAIIRWKLLLYSVSEYISLIIAFSTCTWSENLYYPTTNYKINSENHQIWMLKGCFLSIMAFPVNH